MNKTIYDFDVLSDRITVEKNAYAIPECMYAVNTNPMDSWKELQDYLFGDNPNVTRSLLCDFRLNKQGNKHV